MPLKKIIKWIKSSKQTSPTPTITTNSASYWLARMAGQLQPADIDESMKRKIELWKNAAKKQRQE